MPDMYWQYGFKNYSYGANHNDGFTIYLEEFVDSKSNSRFATNFFLCSDEAQPLIYEHAARVNALNGGNATLKN